MKKLILFLIGILAIALVPNIYAEETISDPHLVKFVYNITGKSGGITINTTNGTNPTLIGTCGNMTIRTEEFTETYDCNTNFDRERTVNTIRLLERRNTCNAEVVNLTQGIYGLVDYNQQLAEEKRLISDILNDSLSYRERAINCEKELIGAVTALNKSREDITNVYLPLRIQLDGCLSEKSTYISATNTCNKETDILKANKNNVFLWAIIAFLVGLFMTKIKNTIKVKGLGRRFD